MSERQDRSGTRLGTQLSRRAVIAAATRHYLTCEPLDMSALAGELDIGRSTLYRLVGNREELIAAVLAEQTELTFHRTVKSHAEESGDGDVLEVLAQFMRAVINAEPLQALSKRDPLLFIRVTLLPGPVEHTSTRLIADLLTREQAAGRLELTLPPEVLGQAIIRMCDAHLYAPLLGKPEPEIDTALDLAAALLNIPPRSA
ncbi:QsdR family transcriptional regulator [Saccharopolyspora mangrovi]|uniref:QsdR family transcriptional regulator n=1 Tax=Saccharopolyspora mangrovi TaxID=3082379 RepID=A0ABU6ABT9_9PSEU|nr:QsdR family transcriptional regulator [Saccharopolyspora sp. S2-29]MEB3368959.1 QsdR family transcriptional regulator [Saccharopolyspora sp. S2-29]